MRLAESYLAYPQAPDLRPAAGAVVEPLESGGYDLEAHLMRRFAAVGPGESRIELPGSPWHGLRVHIGGALPAEVDAGDVWFDVYELAPMILLPRPPPDEDVPPEVGARIGRFVAWMALRPVAIWQFRAFLELASFESRPVQIAPPFPLLDKERILAGAETDPVTRVTCGEAELYAKWFGKGLCDQGDWQAASRFVPAEAMTSLWGLLRREWAGRCGFDESSRLVVNPQSFQLDPQDEADRDEEPPPDLRMLYDEWAKPKGVGFRTHGSTQIGLLRAGGPDPFTFDNVYLKASLRRCG